MNKKYEMIVMDMDDTLLTSENKVSEETMTYLKEIQDQGYKAVLASGRPTEGMFPVARKLGLNDHESYIISYNGGMTIKAANEEVVVNQPVSKKDFDEVIDYCREKGFLAITYQAGFIIHDANHEYMNIESELTGLPMKRVDDMKTFIQGSVPKILGVGYEENITEARVNLKGSFNDSVDVTTSKPFFLEFMTKNVSKGQAITALCKQLDISLDKVICFGDSPNDESMFKVVGYAIAMGNASDSLKDLADEVTLDNNSNGIPHALKQIL